MAILSVGAGKQYVTISAAVAAARDGDTVSVAAGTYVNDFATTRAKISLVAAGGRVTMTAVGAPASARALLTVTTDAVVDGFAFTGLHRTDGTGAGMVVAGGNVVVRNSAFAGNQTGLVALTNAATTLTVETSEFAANGNNDGFSANLSVGGIKSLTVRHSSLHDAAGSTELSSRAAATTVSNSRIQDNSAAAAYAIDLPSGGVVVLQGNSIGKGSASTAAAAIRYGSESTQLGSSLDLSGNTVVSDRPGAVLLQNLSVLVTARVQNNTEYGFAALASGRAVLSANPIAAVRPDPAPSPAPVPVPVPGPAAAIEFGRAGAVVATGHVLTVGAGRQFETVAAAVAASADGDTIDVNAGLYIDDGAVIGHKLIIEGVGGLAQFVATTAPANGVAQFLATTDATFRNVEIFGANTPGGVAAAIRSEGGNLTIVNSTIHDNQTGVVASATAASVGIYDTELARNGTADGRGADVAVAAIGTLTLRNDYLHDAVAGPELLSQAANTVLDGDRISQAAGNGGVAVDLPDAGRVAIGGTAIENGANSQSATLIRIGGGGMQAGSTVGITDSTLISHLAGTPTTFVANTDPAVAVAVARTGFAGGTAGSIPVAGGTNTAPVTKTGVSVGKASPWGATGAPAAAPLVATTLPANSATENGQLILRVSETAWQGDAQFKLLVDGTAVGGVLTATAAHAAGQSQTVTVAGPFVTGPHVVAVQFVNGLGAGDGGRALFVDGAMFNGLEFGAPAALPANGTALLATAPVTSPTAVTVDLSEDTAGGDALAFISIDGKVQGGVQTVTASHGAGETEAMRFLLDLAPGPHSASVVLLNAAAGRALYVDGIDVAGQHYDAAASAPTAEGGSSFAFTVAPPAVANGALFVTVGAPTDLLLLPHGA